MTPVFSRKSFLFLALGVFVLLFGVAQSASAVQCVVSNPATPGTPVWNGGGTCDYPITYQDPAGGSALTTCQYQAINWNESLDPAGWGPAVANPDSCTGDTALMKSGGIVIGSTGDCTLNGQDTCWLYWKAADNSGNSDSGLLKSFDIDYVGPTLTQVTAVPSPTNDTTPNYTFNSTEAGAITYGGDCSSTTTSAVAGDNAVTFNTLTSGVHNNCTVTVTDTIGNASLPLNVNSFTIDTTAPTIDNVSSDKANGNYTVGEVIDIDVTFSEAVTSTGNVTITLETGTTDRTCVFTVSSSTAGTCNYTVQVGDTSADLTVASISGTIKDIALNTMTSFVPATNLAANKAIVIDTVAPRVDAFDVTPKDPAWVNIATPSAVVSWTSTDTGGSGIQKHEVWRAPDSGGIPGVWARIIDNAVSPASSSPTDGTYWYGIHTLDNASNCITEEGNLCIGGAPSDGVIRADLGPIKVIVDKTAPGAPGTPSTSSPTNDTTPTWTWTASTGNPTSYTVYWDTVAGGTSNSNSGIITNAFTHSSALAQNTWYFKVKAFDAAGNVSAFSSNGSVVIDTTPPGTPGTPTTSTPTNDTTPTWSWTASTGSPSSYDVQWATNPAFTQNLGTGTSGTNSFTHSSALAENTWYFKAKARDAAGNESGYSSSGTVVIDTTPPGVPNLTSPSGTISTTTPTFSWNTVNDPSGVTYTLWVDNNSNFGSLEINQSGLASSSYTPGGGILVDGTTYYWKVRAVDGAGNTGNFPAHNTFTVVLNQPSANPTSPLQFKNDGSTPIFNQGFTNETTVKLRASATDADTSEVIRLFFEVALNSGSFVSPATPTTGTSCASGTTWGSCTNKIWYVSSPSGNYSSTPFTGTTSVAGLSTGTGYKWQVKACDDSSACSGWVGINPKPNFSVDTQAPTITTFTITPQSPSWANNASPSITVTWNVSDQGSSHLDRVRVYRAPFDSIDPDRCDDTNKLGCVWTPVGSDVAAPPNSDNWNCPSCVTDTPGSGTWWYGMHVWDKAQNETVEPTPPGVKKALVDTVNPSTAVTKNRFVSTCTFLSDHPTCTLVAGACPGASPVTLECPVGVKEWFNTDFEAILSDSDAAGGSGLAAGVSGCQYRFTGDNPSGPDVCSGSGGSCPGDLLRSCGSSIARNITVGLSPDVCQFGGLNRCKIETKSFDAASNNSGWQQRSFGVDLVAPTINAPTPATAQASVSTQFTSTSLQDTVGHITGCTFYTTDDGWATWTTDSGTISVSPSGDGESGSVSANHIFPDTGLYESRFACSDAAGNTGWGSVSPVQVDSLTVALSAVPSPGGSVNTLFDLTANTAGSTMTGDTTYGFDCRIDTGDCTADGNFADCDLSTTTPTGVTSYTADNLCQYPVTAGTYTAKVAVQRGVGTAQGTVAIGPITTNSDPTTTVRSVDTPNATDYCGVTGYPPVRVRWTFSDADPGDTQGAYELEVFRVSDGVKVVDTEKKPGATQEYVFQSAGEQLLWGTSYTWQVKVWDNHDAASAFIAGPGFTTIAHYYPDPDFTWSPAFPSAEELIQFTDLTNFAGTTGNSWSWDFDSSNGIQIDSSVQSPTHTYTQTKAYGVTLQATDNVGSCSTSQSVNVAVPFPEWQEISPF